VCCSQCDHRQVRLTPLTRLPAVDPGVVGAGAGVSGFPLEVIEPGPDGLPDHVIDLAGQGGPVPVAVVVPCLAGQAGVLPQRRVEDRDRLRQGEGQVEIQGALPGLAYGLDPELALALSGRVRLGGQELGVDVGGFAATARGPAQRGAVWSFALAEQQVIRFPFDCVAVLEAERLGAWSPPAARWLAAVLAGLDVVASGVLGQAGVYLSPDVVQVIALA
jgi:hypothetical protein